MVTASRKWPAANSPNLHELSAKVRGRIMFSTFMVNVWIVGTLVAIVAGGVGFFVVLRGSAFAAHAIPQTGFAGAAAATLLGVNILLGLGVFAAGSALTMGVLGRRGRSDVATALALVASLGLGALFLSFTTEYSSGLYSLLFGEMLGISSSEVTPTASLALVTLVSLSILYRPLLLTSVVPDLAMVRGIRPLLTELSFLLVVALATTMSVPVVGALLMFALMIGPSAAAERVARRPETGLALAIVLALVVVWLSIALSYESNLPIGFFVGLLGAVVYLAARVLTSRWLGHRSLSR